ncbi:proteasome assembly chaperone family protein [Halopiger thermotolerans]|jgi:uncharacterized protein
MVDITVRDETIDLTEPVMIEGLPGVGLVGKIATDHIINQLDMRYFGDITGGELPPVALFEGPDPDVKPPIRLFADEEHDVLALRSDVPVSAVNTPTFAAELTVWLDELNTTPVYLSGFPSVQEPEAVPTVYGVTTGEADQMLADADITPPVGSGMISGPAGALLSHARDRGLDSLGLIVETDPRYPDPQGARVLIDEGINPLTGLNVDTSPLVEQAEEIISQREELAQRMQKADRHESSQTSSVDMY